MSEQEKSVDKISITDTDVVRQKLDEVEINMSFGIQNDAKVKVTGVKVKLVFASTTVFEALKFASGGQSFRVAIQARLRKLTKAELIAKTHIIAMSDVFNPPRRVIGERTPEQLIATLQKKMSTKDIIAMLVKQQKEEAKAKEAK